MSGFSDGIDQASYGIEQAAPNYRHRLANCIPACVLAYQMIIWPMINPQIGRLHAAFTSINLIVYPVLAVIAFSVWLLERPHISKGAMLPAAAMGAFWLYFVLTSLWADDPSNSFSDTVPNTILFLALFFSCTVGRDFDDVLRPIFIVVVATVAFNALFVLTMPPGPIGHRGAYFHKNEFGFVAAMCILVALPQLRARQNWLRLIAVLTIAVGLIELDASDSKTSLGFVFLAPLVAFGIVVIQRYFRVAAAVQILIYMSMVFFVFWLGAVALDFNITDLSVLVSGEPTFTGRVGLWEFAIEHIREKFVWGHGYNSFWQIGVNSASHDAVGGFEKTATAGHNTYIDLLLHGGVVALGLMLLALFATWVQISRVIERDVKVGFFLSSMFLFLILQSQLEAVWFTPSGPTGAAVALMAFFPMIGQDRVTKMGYRPSLDPVRKL